MNTPLQYSMYGFPPETERRPIYEKVFYVAKHRVPDSIKTFTTIMDAMNACDGVINTLIVIYPGTYTEYITMKPNVSLMGFDKLATILSPPAQGRLSTGVVGIIQYIDTRQTTMNISNLSIVSQVQGGNNVLINLTGATQVSTIKIFNCFLYSDCSKYSLLIWGTTSINHIVSIQDVIFRNSGTSTSGYHPITLRYPKKWKFEGCLCEANGMVQVASGILIEIYIDASDSGDIIYVNNCVMGNINTTSGVIKMFVNNCRIYNNNNDSSTAGTTGVFSNCSFFNHLELGAAPIPPLGLAGINAGVFYITNCSAYPLAGAAPGYISNSIPSAYMPISNIAVFENVYFHGWVQCNTGAGVNVSTRTFRNCVIACPSSISYSIAGLSSGEMTAKTTKANKVYTNKPTNPGISFPRTALTDDSSQCIFDMSNTMFIP